MAVLITGGTGYIGSHLCLELLQEGYEIVVLDNLTNSRLEALKRVEELTNKDIKFYKSDLVDLKESEEVFIDNNIESVIHLAGLKAVGESIYNPIKYYRNNITGLVNLLELMNNYDIRNFVFSSSATVYGLDNISPLTEDMALSPINPYGRTKLISEKILGDVSKSDNRWSIEILRYFNPVGAHESSKIGEDPQDVPDNLMPTITQVAIGRLKKISVYGDDYNTRDGTCVRDYIHVVDLAKGHIRALEKNLSSNGVNIYNLGTGKGYSVLEVINTFNKVIDKPIPYEVVGRRAGDIDISYADVSKANKELGWKANKSLEEMCRDSYNWQRNNPMGYVLEK